MNQDAHNSDQPDSANEPKQRGFRGYLRRSIEGIRVDSERVRAIEPANIQSADIVGVFIRAWPYIAPVFLHVLGFVAIAIFANFWGLFWASVNLGLIYNSVILDDPVPSITATLLLLDSEVWVHIESLTRDQRYQLIPIVVMMAVVSGTLGSVIENTNDYYRVWVMQNINQNLRPHLMAQLNHLSMKYHADSKTGDVIYRLFQDSAMVTQIIQALVIDPFFNHLSVLYRIGGGIRIQSFVVGGDSHYLDTDVDTRQSHVCETTHRISAGSYAECETNLNHSRIHRRHSHHQGQWA